MTHCETRDKQEWGTSGKEGEEERQEKDDEEVAAEKGTFPWNHC